MKVQIGYIAVNPESGWISKGQYYAGAKVYDSPKRAVSVNKGWRNENWEAIPAFIEVPDEIAAKIKEANHI